MREVRYTHLLSGESAIPPAPASELAKGPGAEDRMLQLESEVAQLRQEMSQMREQLAALMRDAS
jgi:uncharacterized protein YceH (UPF0502 family)